MAFAYTRIVVIFFFCIMLMYSPSINGFAGYKKTENCVTRVRSEFRQAPIDDIGIPITDYGYVAGVYVGPERNPITISHYALGNYAKFMSSHNNSSKFIFLNNADWLVDHAQRYGNYSVFEYKFPLLYSPKTIQPIWRSAMAQGLAIEVLSKAYKMTGDISYLESAKKLLNPFFIDVDEGGVTHKSADGGWWYELVANDQGIKPYILNGHLFALLGIYEYYNTTHDSSSKYLFDQGILALKKNLPRFDYQNGTYSYYDLSVPKKISPPDYHKVVVGQLQELFNITKEPIFKTFHDKWNNFTLPDSIFRSETCHRTANPPALIFKPSDYALRFGLTGNHSKTNGTDMPSVYHLDKPGNMGGLMLTSQPINYRADNITIKASDDLSGIIFTFNIEGIHKKGLQINAGFGTNKTDVGWINGRVYNVNTTIGDSVTIQPSRIIGDDYLRVNSVGVYLSNASSMNDSSFTIDMR
jgi:heparosan-N-sulfate-glucuronate 5-epimerase